MVDVAGQPQSVTFKPAVTNVEVMLMGDASLRVMLVNGRGLDPKAFMATFGSMTTVPAKVGAPTPVKPCESNASRSGKRCPTSDRD